MAMDNPPFQHSLADSLILFSSAIHLYNTYWEWLFSIAMLDYHSAIIMFQEQCRASGSGPILGPDPMPKKVQIAQRDATN